MPRNTERRMRLNTVGYQPTVFTPIGYKPVEDDYSIFERSFARNEERQEKAMEKQTAVKTALAQAREKLHRDKETLAWFDNKAKEIEQNIADSVAVGDYGSTINLAIQTAGDLASDTELTARIRNNSEYEQKMKDLDDMVSKGVISEQTAKYIRKKNPYTNNFQYDNEGNIIGSDEWKFKEKPVADLDVNGLFLNAFKTIRPDQISHSRSGDVIDSKGNLITNYSKLGNNTSGAYNISSSSSTTQVKPEEILAQAKRMLMSNPDWELQLKQMYGAAYNSYEENQAKLNSMSTSDPEYNAYKYIVDEQKKLFFKDGIPVKEDNDTFMNYFNYQLFNSDQAKAYGYKIQETSNQLSSKTKSDSGSGSGPSAKDAIELESQQGAPVLAALGSFIAPMPNIGNVSYSVVATDLNENTPATNNKQ